MLEDVDEVFDLHYPENILPIHRIGFTMSMLNMIAQEGYTVKTNSSDILKFYSTHPDFEKGKIRIFSNIINGELVEYTPKNIHELKTALGGFYIHLMNSELP